MIDSGSSQICQKCQTVPGKRQLRNEYVLSATQGFLVCRGGYRQVRRCRIPDYHGVVAGVQSNGITSVDPSAPQIGAVDQRVAGRVQLRDKCVPSPAQVKLDRAENREVLRRRPTSEINIPGVVNRKPERPVVP